MLTTAALIWAVAAVTPGPNMLVVSHLAVSSGRAAALGAVAGTITGTLLWGSAGWLGISALFAMAPAAYIELKIAGGGYLVWLGLGLLWRTWARLPGAAPDQMAPPTDAQRPPTAARCYWAGLSTALANPKSAVFVASVFAAALPADYRWTDGAATVAVMVTISTTWYVALALTLSTRRVADGYRALKRIIDTATGVIFAGFGGGLILSSR